MFVLDARLLRGEVSTMTRAVGHAAAVVALLATALARGDDQGVAGGFGHVSAGALLGGVSTVEAALARVDALGEGTGVTPLALSLGGSGRAVFHSGFVLGASGWAMGYRVSPTERGEADLLGAVGSLDLGFAPVVDRSWIVFPFLSLGAGALRLEVQNDGGSVVRFGSAAIPPGRTGEFTAPFFMAGFGISVQKLFFGDAAKGGFMLGGEAGFVTSLYREGWLDDDDVRVSGVEDLRVGGPFLRLTLGAGGFSFGRSVEDDEDAETER
jgi:hypothetical protein